jgi:magnesium chelatase family protein
MQALRAPAHRTSWIDIRPSFRAPSWIGSTWSSPCLDHGDELAAAPSEASDAVRSRVIAGQAVLASAPELTHESEELLSRAVERLPLSGRGRARVSRVARTIASLASSESVKPEHLAEALSYRSPAELGGK